MLYYQLHVDLSTGKIIGVEALIRWRHPKCGMISPCGFILLAEETFTVIGEGIEKEEQGDFLLQNSCQIEQGYFFSRPLGVEQMEKVLGELFLPK